jgi:hypothetical protein
MSVKINASTSSGLVVDSDLTGSLRLQTGGNDALTVDSSQVVNFTKQFQFGGVLPPAFSAVITGAFQTVTTNTYTKVQLGTELFDTNNNFDSTTNYRFTPTVAGYYQINASVAITYITATTTGGLGLLYKNGYVYYQSTFRNDSGNGMYGNCNISTLVYLNGSTDYLELFGYAVGGTGPAFSGTQAAGPSNISSWMNGYLARAA